MSSNSPTSNAKTVAIIQARLGSERLPRKVLSDIAGKPMLQHVVERTMRSQRVDQVVVATTDNPKDQELVDYCESQKWNVFVGSEHDVLSRYFECANAYDAQTIVRITSDCPLIAPTLIDQVIDASQSFDYACNFYPDRVFPRGLEVEAFSLDCLMRVHQTAVQQRHREHVTLMIYENEGQFRITGINETPASDLSGWRWTVDTADDLNVVRNIFQQFPDNQFTWENAAKAFAQHPGWQKLNQHIKQKVA